MNQSEGSANTGSDKGQDDITAAGSSDLENTVKNAATGKGIQGGGSPASTTKPKTNGAQQKSTIRQKLRQGFYWLCWPGSFVLNLLDSKRFRRFVILAATICATVIAWRQNTLIGKANAIADSTAAAAKSAAETAGKALQFQKDGEEMNLKTAKAIQATAEANKSTSDATVDVANAGKSIANATKDTANATKAVATENAKTAKSTKDLATIAERTLKAATDANKSAERAATASENAVAVTKKAINISANTTIRDLRAYLSVMATDLRYERDGNRMVATVTIENTGKTPAHDVDFYYESVCRMRVNRIPQDATGRIINTAPAQRSFGPSSPGKYSRRLVAG